ncbi:MAG: hypothetical protein E6J02_03850 [Chloroflexi bacterium]|nr:MAG: hypothetical protein E6J02_03850 [Chloroflexota bacterium]
MYLRTIVPMIVSLVGLTTSGTARSSLPPRVTQATSGAKPWTCSASFMKTSSGIKSGKIQFSWPVSAIRSSKARRMASQVAVPRGRSTIVPAIGA